MWVKLGNISNPIASGQQITILDHIPDNANLDGVVDDITRPNGVVSLHFAPGTGPVWVQSDNEDLQGRLQAIYNVENVLPPPNWGGAPETP